MTTIIATSATVTPIDASTFQIDVVEAVPPAPPVPSGGLGGNLLINPQFQIAQRGETFSPALGDYTLDRWKAADAGFTVAKLDAGAVLTLGSGRAAIAQILEAGNSTPLAGEAIGFGVSAKTDAGTPVLKAALVAWTGTEDKPTNPVTTWDTTPVLAASWSYASEVEQFVVTGTTQRFEIDGVAPAGVKNLAVLIWVEGSTGGQVYLTKTKLELGSPSPFAPRLYHDEITACWRYFQRFTSATLQNTDHGYGRIDNVLGGPQMRLILPLYAPIRGRPGAAGTADVSVDWQGGSWTIFAGGASWNLTGPPVLTCVHGYFLNFKAVVAGMPDKHFGTFWTMSPSDEIWVDAEL